MGYELFRKDMDYKLCNKNFFCGCFNVLVSTKFEACITEFIATDQVMHITVIEIKFKTLKRVFNFLPQSHDNYCFYSLGIILYLQFESLIVFYKMF